MQATQVLLGFRQTQVAYLRLVPDSASSYRLRVGEELHWRRLLHDLALVHEHHERDRAREAHLVGDAYYGLCPRGSSFPRVDQSNATAVEAAVSRVTTAGPRAFAVAAIMASSRAIGLPIRRRNARCAATPAAAESKEDAVREALGQELVESPIELGPPPAVGQDGDFEGVLRSPQRRRERSRRAATQASMRGCSSRISSENDIGVEEASVEARRRTTGWCGGSSRSTPL